MTYSIVARDPDTGELGVAVQSHYFGTGTAVTWAESGVGAVATQSIVDVGYGPRGLAAMGGGASAADALAELVAADPMAIVRQVAMIDASGSLAVHTGAGCVGHAGDLVGHQVSVQANMMERPTVWPAMLAAYEAAAGEDLAGRLMAALDAAEAEGGDWRGRQSAALLVVSGVRSDRPWDERLYDLRVDDSEAPLVELRRLLDVKRAVRRMTDVFESGVLFAPELDPEGPELRSALDGLGVAQQTLGDNREPSFWSAVLLAKAGRFDQARERLDFASETNPRWPGFLHHIAAAGVLAPDSPLLQPVAQD